jgi:hypothetical protein
MENRDDKGGDSGKIRTVGDGRCRVLVWGVLVPSSIFYLYECTLSTFVAKVK